ncbi:MAG: beta-ketoacyl-ACP synthase II [Candidatus Wallbacteria bacterium]
MVRRVVITGFGVVSPIGCGLETFWNGLLNGANGIDVVTTFDVTNYTSKMAAEVKNFNPEEYIEKRECKRMDRFTQFAVAASKMAVANSSLNIDSIDKNRFGVILGSGIGGIQTFEAQYDVLKAKGPNRVSPLLVPMMIGNMAAGQVAIQLGARGVNFTTVTACASGNHAIGEAFETIRYGRQDVIIAGGSEAAITPLTYAGFASMRAFSQRNDDVKTASRPFNKDRDGFVIGEGAGVLILEEYEHAKRRGAKIYAEMAGYGATCDAFHITSPAENGEGAARSMQLAIDEAGIKPEMVDYVNAHGTSTELNDKYETMAIKTVFGEHAKKLSVSSTKSMTGHLLGAAAGIEAIATAMAVFEGKIPPTINYITPDPELDLDYTPNVMKTRDVKYAISNSLGFGGHNSTICIKKYENK